MKYSAIQYANTLYELAEEVPPKGRREMVRQFVATVGRNGSLALLPEIIREFGVLSDKKEGLHRATVSAPERLPEGEMARKLHLKAKVTSLRDARLMGGAVIEVSDLRVDNSIAMRLARARKVLAG